MIKLIVGLANPGQAYQATRHNAGAWLIERLCQDNKINLRLETKLKAQLGQIELDSNLIKIATPTTYMNESGQTLNALIQFYKILPEECLIVHDEIDLAPGIARLKLGGGEGGHNGLRDISQCLGTKNYYRLRIGVGHPGNSRDVVNYVLEKPSVHDRKLIDESIENALAVLAEAVNGNIEKAMTKLHTLEDNN